MSWAEVKKINSDLSVPLNEKQDDMLRHLRTYLPVDLPSTPGPKAFKSGDFLTGYFGHTTAAELISGTDLASAIGLSAGTAMNSTDGWLKWSKNGRLLYTARKPQRKEISWDHIDWAGAVFGSKRVTIKGNLYKVRLLTIEEWDDIIVGTHESSSVGWESYSNAGLGITGDGSYCWCQDIFVQGGNSLRATRGNSSAVYLFGHSPNNATAIYGWRPCLELLS